MKKHLFIAASALLALASCTDDSFVGEQSVKEANEGGGAISFNMSTSAVTRAGGSTAATALGNRFIVYGEKGAITNAAPTTGNLVFPNYQVNYANSTDYTTTSNTKGWEYVGYTHSEKYQANIKRDPSSTADDEIAASNAAQTIKYWDYAADNYIFTAVSALDADIENDRVKIQKNEYGTGNYDKGYTITLSKSGSDPSYTYPTLNKLYFSDRKVIAKSAGSDRNAVNAYGGNVTLTFRNLVSQIRAGIYETIPGYDVKEIKFYISDGDDDGDALDETTTHAFGAICPNTKTDQYEGTITVVYYTNSDGDLENQPKVTVSGTPATDLILGNNFNNLSTSSLLAKSSAEPTWDKSDKSFTEVLPQINNSSNLKLTVDYTLWNEVTQETIEVKGATAEIPAVYLQWKPNYKYTYLFKISDNTNGWTNPSLGPAGLWPITFDAIEITNSDGLAEYITIVNQPSITTFGAIYNTTDSKYTAYQTGKDEYQLQTSPNQLDIYATFLLGANVLTPQLTSSNKANFVTVYAVNYKSGATDAEKAEKPITEGSVAESIANPTGNLITATAIQTENNTYFNSVPASATSVPAEDGTTKTINALKLPGVKTAGKYAVEIVTYEEVTLTEGAELNGYYSVDGNGEYTKQTTGTYSSGTYYKQVKTYKVITVAAAD